MVMKSTCEVSYIAIFVVDRLIDQSHIVRHECNCVIMKFVTAVERRYC